MVNISFSTEMLSGMYTESHEAPATIVYADVLLLPVAEGCKNFTYHGNQLDGSLKALRLVVHTSSYFTLN
jgi:hypothetical protein